MSYVLMVCYQVNRHSPGNDRRRVAPRDKLAATKSTARLLPAVLRFCVFLRLPLHV